VFQNKNKNRGMFSKSNNRTGEVSHKKTKNNGKPLKTTTKGGEYAPQTTRRMLMCLMNLQALSMRTKIKKFKAKRPK